MGNFQLFSTNFCHPKLCLYLHFDFISKYELRYIIETNAFLSISKLNSFP